MQNVLGQAPANQSPATAPQTQSTDDWATSPGASAQIDDGFVAPSQQPGPDLQSRLAAIAKNIESLENKVTGNGGLAPAAPEPTENPQHADLPAPLPVADESQIHQQVAPDVPTAAQDRDYDPLEALRRRKRELDSGAGEPDVFAADEPQPQPRYQPDVAPAAQMPAPPTVPQIDTTAHLDAQFARLTDALADVRSLAQSSAEQQANLASRALPALEVLPTLQSQVAALEQRLMEQGQPVDIDQSDGLSKLEAQIGAVQQTLAHMPTPDAIRSLEEGYHHILQRLDGLKGDGTADEKVDALYSEVTGLREALDTLSQSGTGAVLDEMRSALSRLESDGQTDQARITAALEEVSQLARGMSPDAMQDSIGAIVERLVALEARIEALSSPDTGSDQTAERLDAIQSELSQLSRFRDEIGALHSALDTIRDEVRDTSPSPVDMSFFDNRLGAIDRIEQATGGYGEQIDALNQRLEALGGNLADQSEVVRQVAALSRQVDTFTNTIPVREIEQALLDLTGRVTALQEDDTNVRLTTAVHVLNERVDACIAAMPNGDALVDAVEARLEPHFGKLDSKVDAIYQAISAEDGPIIDAIAARIEKLISSMPGPRADEGLAQLEQHIVDLNRRYDEAGMISRDEVRELSGELSRVRASVELGTNNDLQQAIADQVRQLADNFDAARQSGNAAMLPAIENQIQALSSRIDALGASSQNSESTMLSDEVARQIQIGFGQMRAQAPAPTPAVVSSPEVGELRAELVGLRQSAGEQDRRLHETLGSVQNALETVIARIENLESDDKAALSLAQQSRQAAAPAKPAVVSDVSYDAPSAPMHAEVVSPEHPEAAVEAAAPAPAVQQPGDAQDLLRQLSGAMDADGEPSDLEGAAERAEPRQTRAEKRAAAKQAKKGLADESGAQRASFIAAARRAAQAAALQAASGAEPGSVAASDAVARLNALDGGGGTKADGERIEPGMTADGHQTWKKPDTHDEADVGAGHSPDADVDPETGVAMPKDDGSVATAFKGKFRKEQKPKDKSGTPKRPLSRAATVAIGLFVIGVTLLLAGFFVTGSRNDTVVAPLSPSVGTTTQETGVRVVGPEESSPVTDVAAAASEGAVSANAAAEGALAALEAETTENTELSEGFQRGETPVMDVTPGVAGDGEAALDPTNASVQSAQDADAVPADAPTAETASSNGMGPLSGLTPPALPTSVADSLPEAIGSPRLRVAAAGGDPAAQFEIAVRYTEGRFVAQDFAAAAYWYGQAAEQGIVPAAYRLATFYEQGRGVERSPEAAIAWYELAAMAGNPRAMHNLAVMAAEGRSGPVTGVDGPDFQRAAAWFEPAASRGLSDSQFNLAVLFARGMGVERDLMRSYQWFALAALAGDEEAVARRDEVAAVLGQEALALATARTESWQAIPVASAAIAVPQPEGGWDDDVPARAEASATRDMVAIAQSLLAERGYDPGPADGLVGPRTSEAVRAFRQSAGLGDSEQIDAALLNALREGSQL
ncbi:MAG: peptidoglycan-binding protein [Pseudomonadota bacterium]